MQPNERSSHEALTAVAAIHVCLVGFQVDSVFFVFLQLFGMEGGRRRRDFVSDTVPPKRHASLIENSEIHTS